MMRRHRYGTESFIRVRLSDKMLSVNAQVFGLLLVERTTSPRRHESRSFYIHPHPNPLPSRERECLCNYFAFPLPVEGEEKGEGVYYKPLTVCYQPVSRVRSTMYEYALRGVPC